jgi:hypothetical protein
VSAGIVTLRFPYNHVLWRLLGNVWPLHQLSESPYRLTTSCRYFMMYGVSPFERVLNEAGGSLMLAVINNAVSWPHHDTYPEELRTLVKFCLNSDPATRPFIDDILKLTMNLMRS